MKIEFITECNVLMHAGTICSVCEVRYAPVNNYSSELPHPAQRCPVAELV